MRWRASVVVAVSLGACNLFDPLDDLTGGDAAAPAEIDAGVDQSAPVDAGGEAEPPCKVSPYEGGKITEGFLCGVGGCRKRLTGPDCRVETVDGGKQSPCATAFPVETPGNGADDNCDGVVDEGYASASAYAGLSCRGCAYGTDMQRLADGTLQTAGGVNNRDAGRNTADCINSTLCSLGAAAWMRNVSRMNCTSYCASIGGTCRPACSTDVTVCNGPAVGVGFGTYANDYRCTVPAGHPSGVPAGTPLTGDCNKTFPGVIDPSVDFNYACCCEL
ncbi:MAG: hypothetical protein KF819_09500 [Labilithrix sp.]|nr:hypothetical protein [Labilithrix sp.]